MHPSALAGATFEALWLAAMGRAPDVDVAALFHLRRELFQTDLKRYAKLIKDSGTVVD